MLQLIESQHIRLLKIYEGTNKDACGTLVANFAAAKSGYGSGHSCFWHYTSSRLRISSIASSSKHLSGISMTTSSSDMFASEAQNREPEGIIEKASYLLIVTASVLIPSHIPTPSVHH